VGRHAWFLPPTPPERRPRRHSSPRRPYRARPTGDPGHFLSTSSKSASTTPGSGEPPASPQPGGGVSAGPPFPYISTPIFCASLFSASIAFRRTEMSSVVRTFRRASNFSSTDLRVDSEIPDPCSLRSEEHTSELQSRVDLVCRLLLEKKT